MAGAPGIAPAPEESGKSAPQSTQTVLSGSFTVPQFGHFFGKDISPGLKHISFSCQLECQSPRPSSLETCRKDGGPETQGRVGAFFGELEK